LTGAGGSGHTWSSFARVRDHEKTVPRDDRSSRALFILTNRAGWTTYNRLVERSAAQWTDIDCVVTVPTPPRWLRAIGGDLRRRLPVRARRGWDMRDLRILLGWYVYLRWWLRPSRIDPRRFGVVSFATQYNALIAGRLERRYGVRTAIILDSTGMLELDEFGFSKAHRLAVRLERRAVRRASLLLPFSRWAAESLRNDYQIEWERIVVCQPGTDLIEIDDAGRSAPRAEASGGLTKPSELPLVRAVFIGTPGPPKGLDRLLTWHQSDFADVMELTVVSATTVDTKRLHNVRYLGRLDHGTMMEMLPSFDLLIHPTFLDCSPWVLLEAAAAGVPVIASRTGGIPELVQDGITGLLCDVDDDDGFREAITRLIADRPLRTSMGDAARSVARTTAELAPFRLCLRDCLLDLLADAAPPEAPESLALGC
jgi:glycosyltransferase involved in cell wall biosynthesis